MNVERSEFRIPRSDALIVASIIAAMHCHQPIPHPERDGLWFVLAVSEDGESWKVEVSSMPSARPGDASTAAEPACVDSDHHPLDPRPANGYEPALAREQKTSLCNRCGLSCTLADRDIGGIIRHTVVGGYESTPGNGDGALDDCDGYTFSLCEFCCDWLFQTFVIPVEVHEVSIVDERPISLDGEREFRPALQRVQEDDWRRTKDKFMAEYARREKARERK